jgi:hypothetical protein
MKPTSPVDRTATRLSANREEFNCLGVQHVAGANVYPPGYHLAQ